MQRVRNLILIKTMEDNVVFLRISSLFLSEKAQITFAEKPQMKIF